MVNSFSLSLELVLLMSWLLKHEKNELKKLIEKSIKNGFINELSIIDNINTEELFKESSNISQNISDSILDFLDFLDFLEETLLKTLDVEQKNKPIQQEKFKNTIQKLNKQNIDPRAVLLSIQETKNKFGDQINPIKPIIKKDEEIKKYLFSQILKNWHPKTNDPIN